jgi:hypothetical protein
MARWHRVRGRTASCWHLRATEEANRYPSAKRGINRQRFRSNVKLSEIAAKKAQELPKLARLPSFSKMRTAKALTVHTLENTVLARVHSGLCCYLPLYSPLI